MKIVTNDEVVEAFENVEYQKIMNRAASKFKGILNPDEIDTCKLNALWKALRSYDPEKVSDRTKRRTKFTSYLYRGMSLECKTEAKFIMKFKQVARSINDNIECEKNTAKDMEVREEILSVKHGEIIEDIVFNNCSILEISKKTGISPQYTQVKKQKALKSLKERLDQCIIRQDIRTFAELEIND